MRRSTSLLPYAVMWLWVIVPIVLFALYLTYGAPHAIWSYSYHDNGRRWDPLAPRYYTSCTYVGWGGQTVTQAARGGKCGWVRFFHLDRRPQ